MCVLHKRCFGLYLLTFEEEEHSVREESMRFGVGDALKGFSFASGTSDRKANLSQPLFLR